MKPYWLIPVKKLIHNQQIPNLCTLPYPNHPKGCPKNVKDCNNGKYITDVLNLEKPMWLVYSEFDLQAHAEKMKFKHPNWTERQCRNLLYWQGNNRKRLKERVDTVVLVNNLKDRKLKLLFNTTCPEALGVNIFITAKLSGLNLDPMKDLKIVHHIALLGSPK